LIRAYALGILLVATTLLTGCGVIVTDAPPEQPVQVDAPPQVPLDPVVEAAFPVATRALSLAHARGIARASTLRIRIPDCDDEITGTGFALDAHTLVSERHAIPGAGNLRVSTASRKTKAVGAASAYRIGELAVARVAGTLPRRLPGPPSVAGGTSVVAVVERNGKPHMLPGVVVDSVSGEPYDVPTRVLRLTSEVRKGDTGPVLDPKGRIVAVVIAVDELTTLGVALPASTLRGRALARLGEALEACD
jgi:hypothetical protein